jgi:hypothetical protein
VIAQALIDIHKVVDGGLVADREERLVDQQPQLGVQRGADGRGAAGRLEERPVGARESVAEVLLDALDLRLGHRDRRLRQSEVRGAGLLERAGAALVVGDGGRGDPAVVPQQRLHVDGDEFEAPGADHVVPGPAVRGGHRGHGVPQLVPGRGEAAFADT